MEIRKGLKRMRRFIPLILLILLVSAACSSDSSEATAVYDGTGCTYDGPTEVATGATVSFTFTNESDTTEVTFGVTALPAGTTPEEVLATGIDAISSGDDVLWLFAPSPIGEQRADSATFEEPGQYGVACTDFSGGENDGQGLSYVTMIEVTG